MVVSSAAQTLSGRRQCSFQYTKRWRKNNERVLLFLPLVTSARPLRTTCIGLTKLRHRAHGGVAEGSGLATSWHIGIRDDSVERTGVWQRGAELATSCHIGVS